MKAVLPRIIVWGVNESVCCIEQVMPFRKPYDLRRVEHGVIPETMVSAYDNRSHTGIPAAGEILGNLKKGSYQEKWCGKIPMERALQR